MRQHTSDASGDSELKENENPVSGGAEDNITSQDDSEEETGEAAPQSDDTEKTGTDQSQEDSVIEKNANEINYVFVESPYLKTPGTERIAVSYGDGSESVSDVTLTVRDDAGEESVWDLGVSAGQVYLFTYDFPDESSTGTYEVVSLNVTDEEGEKSIQLSDSGMEAYFGVNEEYDGIEELTPLDAEDAEAASEDESAAIDATVAEIDPDNVEESAEQIANALEEAEEQTDTSDFSASIDDASYINGRTASKSVSGSASSLVAALGAKIQTVAAANAKSGNGNIVVALDPGHDSKHTGASYGNLKEEVLTLKIAQYCKAELETYSGVTVYMTRTTAACPHPNNSSSGGDIGDRVIAAANAGASIYVSIHLNSSTSSSPNGAEVIIPNSNWKPQVAQEGKELAQAILKELQAVGLNLRPTEIYSKDTTVGETYPDGSKSDYFSVQIYAKEAGIPGIIVEHAFLTNSGDRTYLDSEADLKKLGVADATGIAKYLGLSKGDWRTEGGKTYYYENGEKVTGAKKISGSWYYFDPSNSGAMYTGWLTLNGKTYYYNSNGILAIGTKKISGSWYYFSGNGAMHTGWLTTGGKTYYYNSKGVLAIGTAKINGSWYYFTGNGSMHTGWLTTGGKTYYYNSDGKLALGTKKISGSWYYFTGNGSMHTGWLTTGGKTYYYNSKGVLTIGTAKISGSWYYFTGNGSMHTGWLTTGGKTYYYNSEGVLAIGKVKISGAWYYFTGNGSMYTGWLTSGGKTYYYDTNGVLISGTKKISGYWYYFRSDGSMQTGWYLDGKDTYYYDSEGHLAIGETVIGGKTYYFQSNGKRLEDGFANRKYYNADGILVSQSDYGKVFYKIEGNTTTNVDQMVKFYETYSPIEYPQEVMSKGGAPTIQDFAKIFCEEAEKEGIRAEVLWAQTMLETGYLKFGGAVKIEQYNFSGLGATDGGAAGADFSSYKDQAVRMGVRAQVQHMKAYVSSSITKSTLKEQCVDPRFDLVSKGSAAYVEILGQKENPKGSGWATDSEYGLKIRDIIYNLLDV